MDLTVSASRRAGELRPSAGGWALSSSEDKWDSLTMVLVALLEGRNVLFAGPMFPEEACNRALRVLGDLDIDHSMAFLTSGSTGWPKLVVHSLESVIQSATLMIEALNLNGARVHHLFPANYMAGVLNCTVLPLVAGGTVCLDGSFDFASALRLPDALRTMRSTAAWLSPRMVSVLERLGSKPRFAEAISGSWSLTIGATGALAEDRRASFVQKFGVALHNSYGTTEHMFISVERQVASPLTCGQPLAGVAVRVVDGEDALSSPVGILEVQTPTAARLVAEVRDEERPRIAYAREGVWTRTGDLGFVSNGLLEVRGRIDDVVVLGGLNVSTRQVETALASVASIDEVCCFAFTDRLGEQRLGLGLEVSKEDQFSSATDEAREIVGRDFPREAWPRWIEVSVRLPRTVNGKIDRQRLQQLAREQSRV
jgi:acyl-coenzyme A synthetase/AMP-(fatty) acid ligase